MLDYTPISPALFDMEPSQRRFGQRAKDVEQAAPALGIQIRTFAIRDGAELASALLALAQAQSVGALLVHPAAPLFEHRARIMEFAVNGRVIALSSFRLMAEAGALAIYSPDLREHGRLAADYVDKILKGVKPGDLPVHQPTKFEFVINVETAKAQGLAIPASVLVAGRSSHRVNRQPYLLPWVRVLMLIHSSAPRSSSGSIKTVSKSS